MTHQNPPEHFKGKSVSAHLKDARMRGAAVFSETHGTEIPGHFSALINCAKDTTLITLLLFVTGMALEIPKQSLFFFFIGFGLGYLIWKTGRRALVGWNRLERLHRVIEEERWEIQHHRDQEKEELREMYQAKGFSGKLLDEVVDVLMADDNRLLRVMLEEELGLSLEAYEHPLKQAFGAFLGTSITLCLVLLVFFFWNALGIFLLSALILLVTSNLRARYEKRKQLPSMIWNLALALFASCGAYFLMRLLTI